MVDIGLVIAYYGSIVAIMNPFTALNNYITLTQAMRRREAERVIRQAMIVVVFLGLLFILAGKLILEFYHLSLASLKFGGGLLLLYIAIDMLSGQPKTRSIDNGEVAVVPLATPMTIGPGTMTLLINLGTTGHLPEVIASFLLSTLTVAATMKSSYYLRRVLGRNGIKAMARFMSLIIASVAAQMLWSAVKEWSEDLGITGSGM
ncbi:MAG: MarC family protein [Desulfurococcales archaeon]|nr:MarC family protein [Desulfurococcales archaeon]